MQNKRFTVVAIYEENHQRYATDGYGPTATDAVIHAIEQCRADNKEPDMELRVCAVFRGSHSCKDITVSDARERPEERRCRAKKDHKFTVVQDGCVEHVMSRNAIEAELGFGGEVAGVFRGHLNDLSHEVDWDRVDAATEVVAEAT
ncbi:hypothetical protein WJ96_05085 [Burkholderia ubonensis]|uniref:Uncharacterized protein n=1 Tax=Burkholderia ubonensis TaxID=101571 RepID=A0AAW3N1S8_9BURK|nr:hypothetical protein [Burkholderia ubonensis]KVP75138.1 hypothetical protein WJ93_06905 [Burkholderia ubonensis]KVP96601.1 hypothetical protein WJ97_12005 [Burkholderia ubonensis]KVP97946.1 hypothetical protein WJ96_05085 [Burkholderia ubonensis]KVZ92643.1 hypothetical protein WL25_16740 [Burkholderia ubonensis]